MTASRDYMVGLVGNHICLAEHNSLSRHQVEVLERRRVRPGRRRPLGKRQRQRNNNADSIGFEDYFVLSAEPYRGQERSRLVI